MPTTHTTPIDLRGFHGREFEGVLKDGGRERTAKGMISVNKSGRVLCCQNEIDGISADNKLGYPFSLCVQFQGDPVWNKSCLTSITILDPPSSIDPRWDWKDGEEVESDDDEERMKCRVISDNIVAFVFNVGTDKESLSSFKTFREAYNNGYRKLPSPPTRKLTEITEEMFRSTAWYGKKVMVGTIEYDVITVYNLSQDFELFAKGYGKTTKDYSQCKLIEE